MLAITQVVLIGGPTALFALLGKWRWRETFKLYRPSGLAIVAAILLGVGLAPAVDLVSKLQGRIWPQDPETAKFMSDMFVPHLQAHPILTALFVGLFAGVFEEFLFRGPVQTSLMRRSSPLVAIAVTAVIFGGAHLDLHGLALRALLGFGLGYVVWRTNSIFPAMLMHALYDTSSLLLAAWEIKVHGADATAPDIGSAVVLRCVLGALVAAAGIWLLTRVPRAIAPVDEPLPEGHGFEVVRASGPV